MSLCLSIRLCFRDDYLHVLQQNVELMVKHRKLYDFLHHLEEDYSKLKHEHEEHMKEAEDKNANEIANALLSALKNFCFAADRRRGNLVEQWRSIAGGGTYPALGALYADDPTWQSGGGDGSNLYPLCQRGTRLGRSHLNAFP